MTTLLDTEEPGPAIHVLAIGIGRYDWFQGGYEYRNVKGGSHSRKLGQLTSPPVSAQTVCDWFKKNMGNLSGRILGSIEAVIAAPRSGPETPQTGEAAAEATGHGGSATHDDVAEAFGRWYDRCNRHPDNVAIFYFCGHGIQMGAYGDHILLLQDTGRNSNNWFRNTVNMDKTIQNMRGNQAAIQCYFIDACRDSLDTEFEYYELDSAALCPPLTTSCDPEQVVVHSTGIGALANGQEGEATLFTQAVLRSLQSARVSPTGSEWRVAIDSIGPSIDQLMKWPGLRTKRTPEQQCVISGTYRDGVLFTFPERPDVPFHLTTAPGDSLTGAEWSLYDARGNLVASRPNLPEPWIGAGPPGEDEIEVSFKDGPYGTTRQTAWLMPPCFHRTVQVETS